MYKEYSLEKGKIKVLLLEGIHDSATEYFRANGYNNVESFPNALDDEALKEKL